MSPGRVTINDRSKPRRRFAPGYTATPERLALEERRIREAWAPPSTTPELDVHGMDRERAIQELDLWLNRNFMRGVSRGRVLCGQGRGVLLAAVGKALGDHPLVDTARQDGPAFVVDLAAADNREIR